VIETCLLWTERNRFHTGTAWNGDGYQHHIMHPSSNQGFPNKNLEVKKINSPLDRMPRLKVDWWAIGILEKGMYGCIIQN